MRVFGRGGCPPVSRPIGEKDFDLSNAHFSQMALVVIENIALCPVDVGFLCVGIMFQTSNVAKLAKGFLGFEEDAQAWNSLDVLMKDVFS
ncbi:MAG: hypothetical protein NZ840_06500 [Anaerolineales bacterium]|nr:hypothetical protein [Anaerolineales bacterium]MDW8161687.1 hypothetical protein [Anaerolineales bacterium]